MIPTKPSARLGLRMLTQGIAAMKIRSEAIPRSHGSNLRVAASQSKTAAKATRTALSTPLNSFQIMIVCTLCVRMAEVVNYPLRAEQSFP